MKFLLVVAATLAVASAGSISPALKMKVQAGGFHEAILDLPSIMEQVEADPNLNSLTGDAKVQALVAMLKDLTSTAQASYMTTINKIQGLKADQFWAANIVHLKGVDTAALETLAQMKGDFELREPFYASIYPAVMSEVANITQNPQWGVSQIRAPAAWAVTQGQGQVVGVIDTGVNGNHVALRDNFGGAWSDPYYNNANPTDTHGHGSHCAGTICGTQNGIGVAPQARWVACRGLNNQGSGGEAQLTTCAQFMITANPRPSIVSNSWGGGAGQTWYNQQITAWRNANIIPVFAIGNSGSGCRTANSPGDQPGAFSVGSTFTNDVMSTFSSRGPTTSGLLKPEISAPGQNIVSAGTGANNYVTMSGTSMATPHMAGAAALVRAQNPNWTVDQVIARLQQTTAKPTLTAGDRNCGLPTPGQDFPNHAFGHGRCDVGAAVGV